MLDGERKRPSRGNGKRNGEDAAVGNAFMGSGTPFPAKLGRKIGKGEEVDILAECTLTKTIYPYRQVSR